jgi:hypothetical protein
MDMMKKDPREMALEAVKDALGMGKMKSVLGDDFGMPAKPKSGVTIIVVKGDAREELPVEDEMEMDESEDIGERLKSMGE